MKEDVKYIANEALIESLAFLMRVGMKVYLFGIDLGVIKHESARGFR